MKSDILVPLAELFLDPNNARLIDDPLWQRTPEDRITDPAVQADVRRRLLDDAAFRRVASSIRHLGWLDVEPVRARRLEGGELLVVDGNLRVAALGEPEVGQLTLFARPPLETPSNLTVWLDADATTLASDLAQEVRHRASRSEWGNLSTAVWRHEARQRHAGWPETPVGARLPSGLRGRPDTEQPALELARLYRTSRWGDQFRPEKYQLFREVLAHAAFQEWLGLTGSQQQNSENAERLFSWMSVTRPTDDLVGEDPGQTDGRAVLRTPGDVRRLASLLTVPGALDQVDITGSLDVAASFVQVKHGPRLPLETLQGMLSALRTSIVAAGEEPVEPASEQPWPLLPSTAGPGFTSIRVVKHRGLTETTLHGLGRINLLVGVNNAGKTSLLEAVYLLCRLADPRGLIETIRARVRTDPEARPEWLVKLLPPGPTVEGTLDGGSSLAVRLTASDQPLSPETNLATFLKTLRIEASAPSGRQVSATEFMTGRPRRTLITEGMRGWACPAVLHSPFSLADRSVLTRCYERSIEAGTKSEIIEFIRVHIDLGVEDVELVNTDGRFLVQHKTNGSLDLSSYGEGMQRVFQLGLLFAAHPRGVVLIDEFENALHTGVLIDFTRLVQQLALRFDVQVFLTTHSKETVDAFVLNEYRNEDVVAFGLYRTAGGLEVERYAGVDLALAIDAINIDIRRG